jgi:hypothetical protein
MIFSCHAPTISRREHHRDPRKRNRTDGAPRRRALRAATPLEWYPRLVFATPDELRNFRAGEGGGYGIHWPDLDEDLSVKNMLKGLPAAESGSSLKRWKKEMKRRRRKGISGPWASANSASYEHAGDE